MFLRSTFFFSLQLILTLLAASIVIFSPRLWSFHVFFFRNELRLLSFFCFVFRSCSFSVIGVSVVVVGRGRGRRRGERPRMHGHVITKFSRIYRLPFFFFARARAWLILILYYEKRLIINSAIFSNSCTVISEIHILSWRFSWRAVNSQWARGRKMSNNRQGTNSPR